MSADHEPPETLIEQLEDINGARLDPNSYTAHRLHHATPEHLHITTRRVFVGPIPIGWLKNHRSEWYKHYPGGSRNAISTAPGDGCGEPGHSGLHCRDAGDGWSEGEDDRPAPGSSSGGLEPVAMPKPDSNGSAAQKGKGKGRATGTSSRSTFQRSRRRPKPPLGNRGESYATAREWGSTGEGGSQEEEEEGGEDREDREDREDLEQGTREATQGRNFKGLRVETDSEDLVSQEPAPLSAGSDVAASSISPTQSLGASNSLASLLKHDSQTRKRLTKRTSSRARRLFPTSGQSAAGPSILSRARSLKSSKKVNGASSSRSASEPEHTVTNRERVSGGLVRFNNAVDIRERDKQMQMKLADLSRSRTFRHIGCYHHHLRKRVGEIVKMENMLVRVEISKTPVPNDYDENESMKVITQLREKWREFVVVCRQTGEKATPLSLMLYKNRVIPAIDRPRVSLHGAREIPLNPRITRVNLYSSLDKTLVIWLPFKRGSMIYIMRPRCSSSSVEWYTFLQGALGWCRSDKLQISIPDLSLSVTIDQPFARVEHRLRYDPDDEAPIKEERAVAKNLLSRSMDLLGGVKEWENVLDHWKKNERMGLAWRRYDRLEWIHGENEHRMYGSMAMEKTHELELRPKTHYPTEVKVDGEKMTEPAPVEGFLLRLTAGKGGKDILTRLSLKRLYFTTHDNLLCFCKPARALPPPPPQLPPNTGTLPKLSDIQEEIPLIYLVAPYVPDPSGEIPWLTKGTAQEIDSRDRGAYDEGERKVNTLLRAEGFVDLCQVVEVRYVRCHPTVNATAAGNGVPAGDGHHASDTSRVGRATQEEPNDERSFELVLDNGFSLRLQAHDQRTRDEWMTRLKDLVKYWRARDREDLATIRRTRDANLKQLNLDEEMESILGQYARKWEVSRSVASGEIFNVCGISSCRAITMSGVLYRKPRRRATFKRFNVVLCHGELLIFHNTYRKRTGAEIPHTHHDRYLSMPLRDCYVYSGLVTENDLLYQNQTFDSNTPGRHALPRVYQDGMTSHDEDTMTCFVIWHGMKRNLFTTKNDEGHTVRHRVTALGQTGKSVVFKARSRLERDAWVMSIGMEIERLNATSPEDISVTP